MFLTALLVKKFWIWTACSDWKKIPNEWFCWFGYSINQILVKFFLLQFFRSISKEIFRYFNLSTNDLFSQYNIFPNVSDMTLKLGKFVVFGDRKYDFSKKISTPIQCGDL